LGHRIFSAKPPKYRNAFKIWVYQWKSVLGIVNGRAKVIKHVLHFR